MSDPTPTYRDRDRADSFGAVAVAYDNHRPSYPPELISQVLAGGGKRVLDVGAGTGIASAQFAALGAQVLAVEPDARMAELLRSKGIAAEVATFEDWDPAGRTFDVVTFAQSFHWVDPAVALPKLHELLVPGGRLALMWNRIDPTDPPWADLHAIYQEFETEHRPPTGARSGSAPLHDKLVAAGFTDEEHTFPQELHYSTEQWLDMVTTYSNFLTLDPQRAAALRARLEQRIGPDGVEASNTALLGLAPRGD